MRKACAWYAKGLHGSNAFRQRAWSNDDADALVADATAYFDGLRRRPASLAA